MINGGHLRVGFTGDSTFTTQVQLTVDLTMNAANKPFYITAPALPQLQKVPAGVGYVEPFIIIETISDQLAENFIKGSKLVLNESTIYVYYPSNLRVGQQLHKHYVSRFENLLKEFPKKHRLQLFRYINFEEGQGEQSPVVQAAKIKTGFNQICKAAIETKILSLNSDLDRILQGSTAVGGSSAIYSLKQCHDLTIKRSELFDIYSQLNLPTLGVEIVTRLSKELQCINRSQIKPLRSIRSINGGIPDMVESIAEGDWINCLANISVLLHRIYIQLGMTYESVMVSFRAVSLVKGMFSDSFENTSFLLRLTDALEVNIGVLPPIVNPQKDYEANQAWLALKRVRTATLERLGQLVYGINVRQLSAPSNLQGIISQLINLKPVAVELQGGNENKAAQDISPQSLSMSSYIDNLNWYEYAYLESLSQLSATQSKFQAVATHFRILELCRKWSIHKGFHTTSLRIIYKRRKDLWPDLNSLFSLYFLHFKFSHQDIGAPLHSNQQVKQGSKTITQQSPTITEFSPTITEQSPTIASQNHNQIKSQSIENVDNENLKPTLKETSQTHSNELVEQTTEIKEDNNQFIYALASLLFNSNTQPSLLKKVIGNTTKLEMGSFSISQLDQSQSNLMVILNIDLPQNDRRPSKLYIQATLKDSTQQIKATSCIQIKTNSFMLNFTDSGVSIMTPSALVLQIEGGPELAFHYLQSQNSAPQQMLRFNTLRIVQGDSSFPLVSLVWNPVHLSLANACRKSFGLSIVANTQQNIYRKFLINKTWMGFETKHELKIQSEETVVVTVFVRSKQANKSKLGSENTSVELKVQITENGLNYDLNRLINLTRHQFCPVSYRHNFQQEEFTLKNTTPHSSLVFLFKQLQLDCELMEEITEQGESVKIDLRIISVKTCTDGPQSEIDLSTLLSADLLREAHGGWFEVSLLQRPSPYLQYPVEQPIALCCQEQGFIDIVCPSNPGYELLGRAKGLITRRNAGSKQLPIAIIPLKVGRLQLPEVRIDGRKAYWGHQSYIDVSQL